MFYTETLLDPGVLPTHWRARIAAAILSDFPSEKADEIDTVFYQLTAALKKVDLTSSKTGKPL